MNLNDLIIPFDESYHDYLRDETKSVGTAESISFPENEEQISAVMEHFNSLGVKITVQGNRTGIAAAAVPGGGHVMSLIRMNKVTGMRIDESGTAYLKVQPGLSLGELRKMISSKRFDTAGWSEESCRALKQFLKMPEQYFPPDPTESSASIGGMAACNSSGAKTYHYGPTRPYISGIRIVLSDGDVIALRRGEKFARGRSFTLETESGRVISGRVPGYEMPKCKNASGYYAADDMDLIDIFIGSDGTLGAMSEIELRLIKMPAIIWGIDCFFKSEDMAIGFMELARKTSCHLAAIEYFDGNALNILRGYDDGGCPVPDGFDCMVYVEIHAEENAYAMAEIKEIGAAMEAVGGDSADTWAARSLPDRERLLELRHKVPESVNALIAKRKRDIPSLSKVGSDMAVPDDRFREVMAMYHRDLAKNGFQYAMWGHMGNNHIHVNVLPRSKEEMLGGKKMFAEWAETVTKMGGTISAEHGAGKSKSNLLAIMYGEKGIMEMAALKRCFDPKCTLGVGNMFSPEYV